MKKEFRRLIQDNPKELAKLEDIKRNKMAEKRQCH